MSKKNGRFIVLRDIQDHAIKGDLSLFDLGVYSVIHFQTEFSSGVWFGSAARVHATAPHCSSLRDVQRSIEHLEELRFLRSFRKHGQRGNAAYLVHKYEPLSGALRGKRLNAFASDDWRQPVYESCAHLDTETDTHPVAHPDAYSVFSTQETGSKRKKNAAAGPARPADPRFDPFVKFAYDAFQAKVGQKPSWQGKDWKSLQLLLAGNKSLGLEELKARWTSFLASTETFTAKQGYSLAYFCTHVDSFIAGPILGRKGGNGDGKPTATDLAIRNARALGLDRLPN